MDKFTEAIATIVAAILALILISVFLAYPVKWTWNYVIPFLFDFKEISWGQAWCLSFLAGTFFKSHSHK